jgi:predicted amidohydrolase YtcJ
MAEDPLFPSRIRGSAHLSPRQYARIVDSWVEQLGLDRADYGTHTLRRTKATLIYRRTKNLPAVQLRMSRLPERLVSLRAGRVEMKIINATMLASAVALVLVQRDTFASDLILTNGHIYTGSVKTPWAQALSVTGGRIETIGDDRGILRSAGHAAVIDLHGRTVIPGIVDSHVHLLYGAFALHGLNLSTPESSVTPDQGEQLVARLRAYAAAHPADKVLFARADFGTLAPLAPTHELLDRAVTDRPVIVHNTSEHALWLNSKALELAHLTTEPVSDPDEERGIIRDASGHPRGVLLEAAMAIVTRVANAIVPTEEKLAWIREATRHLNRYGITSVVNATGDLDEIKLYATLRDRGQLTVRTRTSFGAVAVRHRMTPKFLADLEEARHLYHDDWVAANLVKFFADGSTGLLPPLVYTPAEYRALVMELDRRGFQIMSHALRDDSVRLILDTYAATQAANGTRERRFRIEHADLVQEADVLRFAKLGVIADMQPAFCCGDTGTNFDVAYPLVSDRWQSLVKSGAHVAFSSDWPCTWPPDPFVAIQQAVTRHVWHSPATAGIPGEPLDGAGQGGAIMTQTVYEPDERVSVQTAVDAYTRGGAFAAFHEDRVGTLEAGKEADLIVLSQDVFSVPADEISSTRVLVTLVGGKVVFGAW